MATAWEVFDVCDKEIILDAGKHPKSFIFLNCRWGIDDKIAFRTIQL